MKALERLRGDEDQDVRYFAGAKSFEEVSLFSDDAVRNDGHSSEEFDDDNHNERAESEEKGAIAIGAEDGVVAAPLITVNDTAATLVSESIDVNDEKLENDIEKVREELQSSTIIDEAADERSGKEDSSVMIAEDLLNSLINTMETI